MSFHTVSSLLFSTIALMLLMSSNGFITIVPATAVHRLQQSNAMTKTVHQRQHQQLQRHQQLYGQRHQQHHQQQQLSMIGLPHAVAFGATALSAASLEWDAWETTRPNYYRAMMLSPKSSMERLQTGIKTTIQKSVQTTYGFSPIFFMLALVASSSSPVACTAVVCGWSVLKLAIARSCRSASSEQKKLLSVLSSNVMVLILGAMCFYNGLHGLALLA